MGNHYLDTSDNPVYPVLERNNPLGCVDERLGKYRWALVRVPSFSN
jgi:hypothetical protein